VKKLISGIVLILALTFATGLKAGDDDSQGDWFFNFRFEPGSLVVTRSKYAGTAATVTIGEILPPICGTDASCTVKAVDDGAFPSLGSSQNVWDNAPVDGSFGVTSPIYLDNVDEDGRLLGTLAVPTNLLVTSFSSKSELAINRSTDGKYLTFVGYVTPPNTLDASNSNTPGIIDPTNPVGTAVYRAVAQVDVNGKFKITDTNAYTGDNGRAAILGDGNYYATGNSNNGSGTPTDVTTATGAEFIVPGATPGVPTEIGDFSITQVINPATGLPYPKADKAGKDNNFRGLTIFHDTLYVTKGSGSNGINTVYQVGTAGTLPTPANAPGGNLAAVPITILPGFPRTLAKATTPPLPMFPFGIWFADDTTLYVADEGDGTTADAATSTTAGLQKWSLVSGTWTLDYVLQVGLNLGQQYSVDGYPTALDPATDGLRNITGRVNWDGTVTIWAITSTVSANGDQGADPNKLVKITDVLRATTLPTGDGDHDWDDRWERFTVVRSAGYGEVLRGVAFAPVDFDFGEHR
jgi:hypothetical protein